MVFTKKETNIRRFKEALLVVGRGNGKSTLAPAIALKCLLLDNKKRASMVFAKVWVQWNLTVAGGMMAMGAGKIAGKAFGFAKSKRAKRALMNGGAMSEKTMNAMGSGGGGDLGDNESASSQSHQEKPLDFRHFWHATEGMSSRAGIVGLAGFGLGVTTLATSKLVGAARGGGTKGFFRQFGIGIATPFKAIGKRFNPQLASKGNQENKRNTQKVSNEKTESLNKKLGKVNKIKDNIYKNNNGFVFINPENKMQQNHNKNINKKTNYKTKMKNKIYKKENNINSILKKHIDKSDDRQEKWNEKDAKKGEKKDSN